MSLNPNKLSYTIKEACEATGLSAPLIPGKLSYNMDEVARLLGVTRKRVQAQVDRRRVPSFSWGGRRLLTAEAVEALRARFLAADTKPQLPESGVYFLYRQARITYIGRSTTLQSRLGNHRRSGREFDRVEVIACDASTADWLEGELIRVLNPPENVVRYARRNRLRARAQRP